MCIRGMLHDPNAYPEPFSFKPDRFLDADGSFRDDPLLTSAFGFGRRVCPAPAYLSRSRPRPRTNSATRFPVAFKDSGTNSRYGTSVAIRTECYQNLSDVDPFLAVVRWVLDATIVPQDDRAKELIIATNMAGYST
jgi:cytochrome P450